MKKGGPRKSIINSHLYLSTAKSDDDIDLADFMMGDGDSQKKKKPVIALKKTNTDFDDEDQFEESESFD